MSNNTKLKCERWWKRNFEVYLYVTQWNSNQNKETKLWSGKCPLNLVKSDKPSHGRQKYIFWFLMGCCVKNLIQLKFLLIISYVDGDCHLDDVCQYEIYNSAKGGKIINFVEHDDTKFSLCIFRSSDIQFKQENFFKN